MGRLAIFFSMSLVWSWSAGGDESDWCFKRAALDRDGQPADMDDCRLWQIIDQADLASHLQECESEVRSGSVQVYGGFGFTFDLNPAGGIERLQIEASAFERTSLPRCLDRVLRKRFRGVGTGKPASIEGRFELYAQEPSGFSVSVWGRLAPRKEKPSALIPGRMRQDGNTLVATCPLGSASLIMRLCTPAGEAIRLGPTQKDLRAEQLAEACEEKLQVEKPNGWNRSDWRRERKEACNCLVGLLAHSNLLVRAAAAERLARERYWRGRRALTEAIHRMLGIADCRQPECPAVAPKGVEEGLSLVRMVRAQLKLRHWIKDEALEALARHPSRTVRLKLLGSILSNRRGKLPSAHGILLQDSDPIVRARASNIGCQRDDRASQRVFLGDLAKPAAEVRAAALLYAGSCAERAPRQVLKALEQESNPAVALLMLQSIPDVASARLVEHASAALFNPCPAVRYLAARLLGRVKKRPLDRLRDAIGREPNPVLKDQLVELLHHAKVIPATRHAIRLWLQL